MQRQHRGIRVVSFDAEGTLASPDFSRAIWQQVVPSLYGERYGMSFDDAAERVFAEYATVGPGRGEWYDIHYWFRRLGLGDPVPVIEAERRRIQFYPEVTEVIDALAGRFLLVVASSTPVEFLRPLLRDIESSFARMFSSTSSCGRLKDSGFFGWMCAELGVMPEEIAHVGDHPVRDLESALAAGLAAFHLDRSATHEGSLKTLVDMLPHLGVHGARSDA